MALAIRAPLLVYKCPPLTYRRGPRYLIYGDDTTARQVPRTTPPTRRSLFFNHRAGSFWRQPVGDDGGYLPAYLLATRCCRIFPIYPADHPNHLALQGVLQSWPVQGSLSTRAALHAPM